MRRIILFMNVSLDGYVADSNHDISWAHNNPDAFSAEASQQIDILLFGRKTYEMFRSFWPTPQAAETAPEIARFLNERRKYVVSHRPFDPGWNNVTVISDNAVESVRALKEEPGRNIMIFGSNTLCVTLMQACLIDEFQIVVNPVVLGEGLSLFKGLPQKTELVLADTRQFKSGAMLLTYRLMPPN